jgi:Tol biopolymer transport system component
MDISVQGSSDVWLYDWSRDVPSRLTLDPGTDQLPIWTPAGLRVTFGSDRADKGTPNLYWQRVDGTGEAERLTVGDRRQWPGSWHPSGKFLVANVLDSSGRNKVVFILNFFDYLRQISPPQ